MIRLRILALTVALALTMASCGEGAPPRPKESPVPRGGTLRVGLFKWNGEFPYDPTTLADFGLLTMYPCCLVRTLYYYNGRPASEGGGIVRPDLATALPEVSADGLTWTIHVRRGVRYGPPLQDVEITAPDFVRALERILSPAPKDFPGPYLGYVADYVLQIEGAQDYADGKAEFISGLETPDRYTLRIRLTQPNGDVPYHLAIAPTGPIPANPFRPDDRFGVAEGHAADGYGRFLVSSGPYMIEGSERIDFAKAPAEQEPPSGLDPLVLVRNPSWRPASDPLRRAYVDRVEFVAGQTEPYEPEGFPDPTDLGRFRARFSRKVEANEIDVIADWPAPVKNARRFETNPALRDQIRTYEFQTLRFLALNLAQPPFDDIHVRKAANYVVNKKRILDEWQRLEAAILYDHLAPNATENNLLANYHPYPSPGQEGDLEAARREMQLSRLDRNRDGTCDSPSCDLGTVPWRNDGRYRRLAPLIKDDLARIGIKFVPKFVDSDEMFATCGDLKAHANLCQTGWFADYPSASTFFGPLYSSQAVAGGCCNFSLVGATPKQLRAANYDVVKVASVDQRMAACNESIGVAQIQCWVAFDAYLMEEVVPAIPLLIDGAPWIFSNRVASFTWDQVAAAPALDKVALKPGSGSA